MRLMGLEAIYQRPDTSQPAAAHQIYPYLLRGLAIERANQVWAADITYIPLARGFIYLVAIIDWFSRSVLAWRLSNTLDAEFCVEALEEALSRYGRPEIFNTDQGSQFTGDEFTGILKRPGSRSAWTARAAASTTSSSSGCGALSSTRRSTSRPTRQWPKPRPALAGYLEFYNTERQHQASVTARRGKFTQEGLWICGRLALPRLAAPPLPERARKAGKCSPSPTYPQAPQSTKRCILMIRKAEALHQRLH